LWLDAHDDMANFHLIFLLEASKYLGFYPDISEMELPFFEMKEGNFSPFSTVSSLSEHDTLLFKKLINLKLESDIKTFHVIERQLLLKILIDYYSYHLEGFRKPKSVEVLKEVFS
jgi:DNA repair protein RecO (recombination protein O)